MDTEIITVGDNGSSGPGIHTHTGIIGTGTGDGRLIHFHTDIITGQIIVTMDIIIIIGITTIMVADIIMGIIMTTIIIIRMDPILAAVDLD